MKPCSGTYALIFSLSRMVSCEVGKLGWIELEPGYYVYVGSAFGPGGVTARTDHHRKTAKSPHWHLDYLRPHMELLEIWYSYDLERREHLWAQSLVAMRGASTPVPGFGSSDCGCTSHFIRLAYKPAVAGFRKRVRRAVTGHAPLHGEVL